MQIYGEDFEEGDKFTDEEILQEIKGILKISRYWLTTGELHMDNKIVDYLNLNNMLISK